MANIVNDYNNTAELIQKFPVEHPTYVADGIGKNIQNRLLTGFENWNRGFDAWKEWGNILYTPDSIYNVHGVRMSLADYQAAMNVTLKQVNIQMGAFHDMIICDDWTAIRYDITTIAGGHEIPGSVMEFVKFKDYGEELGTRVVEGWGAPKDDGYAGMANFQSDAQKQVQQDQFAAVLAYQIPETDDLEQKYPVLYPTTAHSENAPTMKAIILQEFDAWNKGYAAWAEQAKKTYTTDLKASTPKDEVLDFTGYANTVQQQIEEEKVQRLYFDSMLISGEWAAIHYRTTSLNPETDAREAGDRMQFLHFVETEDGLKIDALWTK